MARKKNEKSKRRSKPRVEELERRIALSAPADKKNPIPPPYAPGTAYGLVRRANVRGA